MSVLRLCAGTLPVADPVVLLESYLDPRNGYAWPAYDGLVTNGSPALVSGDLLAPALLGAHVDAGRFSALQEMLPRLAGVADLPPGALEDADDDTVDAVAALFGVLDEARYAGRGVRGTIVSKVLHRKRPDLVPIYDSRIFAAYTAPGVIERVPERSWVSFMGQLCRVMRADLQDTADRFAELEQVAAGRGAALSRLRILDVVVWMTMEAWQ